MKEKSPYFNETHMCGRNEFALNYKSSNQLKYFLRYKFLLRSNFFSKTEQRIYLL